ncbi:hypothetical protein LOZ66_004865 [Ophidiomyces ophidiicola]|nr:hypothetical protein LOZ66_004865 [Ophidiomyces ophidiicola]
MDQIARHRLEKEVQKFVLSIDRSAVCALASSFHPKKQRCQIFEDEKKGSYNICIPVEFFDKNDESTGERWMVRIPLLPRLGFPEEKLRGEIATMKFIAEITTVPIPHLHGYSIGKANILGLPFMLLQYIDGKPLRSVSMMDLSDSDRCQLFRNVCEVYFQLFPHKFSHVGAFTLDSADENWVFELNRPLSMFLNDQALAGYNLCSQIPPDRIFQSTIDYVFMIHRALLMDFDLGKDTVYNEWDVRSYLFALHSCCQWLMEWVKTDYNHGPFILMHGDLRSSNILVDDRLNIMSVLDWEWSHTIPVQMFVPPPWLTGLELLGVLDGINRLIYETCVDVFKSEMWSLEFERHSKAISTAELRLSTVWEQDSHRDNFISLGLNQPHYFGNLYCSVVDHNCYELGKPFEERLDEFFKTHTSKLELVQKKLRISSSLIRSAKGLE